MRHTYHRSRPTTDIEQGEEAYSSDLLSNVSYEIRDVAANAANILYEFIDAPAVMSGREVRELLIRAVGDVEWNQLLDLLFWYGFLGLEREDGEAAYIYSVKYDMRRLRALIQKKGIDQAAMRINPAFWRALEVRT